MMVTNRLVILAGIESVRDHSYAYLSCGRCYSKVLFDEDTSKWICIKCRSAEPNVVRRYRMNFQITDNMQLANVTVFGHNLDKFFGCTADEFHENLKLLSQHCPQFIDESLITSVIEETFVGHNFLFGFKRPHAKQLENKASVGKFPSLDMIRPNPSGSFLPADGQHSENTYSNTVAWHMLFPCSDLNFVTVLARLRQTVDNFCSSQSVIDSVVHEGLLCAVSGYETMPSARYASQVERNGIGFDNSAEQSFVLSCDVDVGELGKRKESAESTSDHSASQCLVRLSSSDIDDACTSPKTDGQIMAAAQNVPFKTLVGNLHFNNNVDISQHAQVCDVLSGKHRGRFCSDVLAEGKEIITAKVNAAYRSKSKRINRFSCLHLKENSSESEKKSVTETFDEPSVDEIETCRAESGISQERRVMDDDLCFKRCSTSAVSREIKKKRISLHSPLRLGIHSSALIRHQSCTLDLVEAPYSEDLEAFLKDCEENEVLTCKVFANPAANSEEAMYRSETVSQDSKILKDLNWEQPYSEDLEEFLRECKSDRNQSQVYLNPFNEPSRLKRTFFEDSLLSDTGAMKPHKPLEDGLTSNTGATKVHLPFEDNLPSNTDATKPQEPFEDSLTSNTVAVKSFETNFQHANSLESLSNSVCSEELFSFWSDDFQQQVDDSNESMSVEKPVRRCSLQRLQTESSVKRCSILSRHLNALKSKALKNSPRNHSSEKLEANCQTKLFRTAKVAEICQVPCLSESEVHAALRVQACDETDMFNSSLSVLFDHNRNLTRETTASNHRTASCISASPAITARKKLRLLSYLNYKTPEHARSNSSALRTTICDSFSDKKLVDNCEIRESIIILPHSTKNTTNRSAVTPYNQSFDLFHSPCFPRTGLSCRQSGLQAEFPTGTKCRFSSTPLSTIRICKPYYNTQQKHLSPSVAEELPERLIENGRVPAKSCIHLRVPSVQECSILSTVPASPCVCSLNSCRGNCKRNLEISTARGKNSLLTGETANCSPASLISLFSPELFGYSSRRENYERKSVRADSSQNELNPVGGHRLQNSESHQAIQIVFNSFQSSENGRRTSTKNKIAAIPCDDSGDLFSNSGDLFLD